jgi:hypothetical protein
MYFTAFNLPANPDWLVSEQGTSSSLFGPLFRKIAYELDLLHLILFLWAALYHEHDPGAFVGLATLATEIRLA